MLEAYQDFWNRYFDFDGVSSRSQYWFVILANILIGFLIGFISSFSYGFGFMLSGLYTLAVFIPGIALSVRRLHDTNKSGWNLLLALIPFVGAIILLIFYCQPSTESKYR